MIVTHPQIGDLTAMNLTIQIGDERRIGMLLLTNAPRRYDFDSTIEVYKETYFQRQPPPDEPGARLVLVLRANLVDEQVQRYQSGLFVTEREIDPELFNRETIAGVLWERLAEQG